MAASARLQLGWRFTTDICIFVFVRMAMPPFNRPLFPLGSALRVWVAKPSNISSLWDPVSCSNKMSKLETYSIKAVSPNLAYHPGIFQDSVFTIDFLWWIIPSWWVKCWGVSLSIPHIGVDSGLSTTLCATWWCNSASSVALISMAVKRSTCVELSTLHQIILFWT